MEHQIPVTITEQEQTGPKPTGQLEIPEQIREVSDRIAEAFDEFRKSETYEKIIDGKESARGYIRNNPLASFGYALGAGVLLGFILKRNR
jgi:ElaB/YqjD/DUF883 family membrane-anchored ribosome-binding protein